MLKLDRVTHRYGHHPVLEGIGLHLEAGQIGCLLGPSGCGKSTVLRLIAGFERLQQGRILLGGQSVSAPGRHLAPEQRQVGMVFQDYALFPHLSVAGNIGFGLHRLSSNAARQRVDAMLALVGLTQFADKRPQHLSGGQQQRVALARALAPRPQLLLLDEAFSGLDAELREKLALEVREILREEGITALVVTHDQHEAFAMADFVGVMHEGSIRQWDIPYHLYHRPSDRFVADFIGQGVLLPGHVLNGGAIATEMGTVFNRAHCRGESLPEGASLEVLIRPDDVRLDEQSNLSAELVRRVFHGADFIYTLALPSGQRVLAMVPSHHDHRIGEQIGIRMAVDHVVAFRRPAFDVRR